MLGAPCREAFSEIALPKRGWHLPHTIPALGATAVEGPVAPPWQIPGSTVRDTSPPWSEHSLQRLVRKPL
jgi:hypothetical protein